MSNTYNQKILDKYKEIHQATSHSPERLSLIQELWKILQESDSWLFCSNIILPGYQDTFSQEDFSLDVIKASRYYTKMVPHIASLENFTNSFRDLTSLALARATLYTLEGNQEPMYQQEVDSLLEIISLTLPQIAQTLSATSRLASSLMHKFLLENLPRIIRSEDPSERILVQRSLLGIGVSMDYLLSRKPSYVLSEITHEILLKTLDRFNSDTIANALVMGRVLLTNAGVDRPLSMIDERFNKLGDLGNRLVESMDRESYFGLYRGENFTMPKLSKIVEEVPLEKKQINRSFHRAFKSISQASGDYCRDTLFYSTDDEIDFSLSVGSLMAFEALAQEAVLKNLPEALGEHPEYYAQALSAIVKEYSLAISEVLNKVYQEGRKENV